MEENKRQVKFADAHTCIRNLFPPDVATGQKAYFNSTLKAGAGGGALYTCECLVRSPLLTDDLKGNGEGSFLEAKRKAAARVLEQLGYTIKP